MIEYIWLQISSITLWILVFLSSCMVLMDADTLSRALGCIIIGACKLCCMKAGVNI
uniref:Uncharacterized protein n=1 Tax=Setaria italica TaxID=4555 RepID=K3ZPS9_SETIT